MEGVVSLTEKRFWSELEKYVKEDRVLDVVRVIRMAYKKDLGIICGCKHTGFETVNQLYVNVNESEPHRDGNRYMLCYTSMAMA